MAHEPHLLIIDARFYPDLADELVGGATRVLEAVGATWSRISVPGVLEIPAALSMALIAEADGGTAYDGFVLLGVVIRGETTHYDVVANESARAVMLMTIEDGLALGNGILTVENRDQAWARAGVDKKDKGGAAARAALEMIAVKAQLQL